MTIQFLDVVDVWRRKMLSFFFRHVSREMFCILMLFLGIVTGWHLMFTQVAVIAVLALVVVVVIDLFREPSDGIDDTNWNSSTTVPLYKAPPYIIVNGVAARLLSLSMVYAIQGLLALALGLAGIQAWLRA